MKVRKWTAIIVCTLLVSSLLAACGKSSDNNDTTNSSPGNTNTEAQQVRLTAMLGNVNEIVTGAKALIAAFEKKYPNIKVEIELTPGGVDGENVLKTKLATGDASDIIFFNSGSTMQALNPEKNFVDLTNEPFQANVEDSFKQTVTVNGKVYGAPYTSTSVGGWFYNKKVYADLGLSVPKTWDEFMANVKKIQESAGGVAPIIGTYKDSWTAQGLLLSDYYNVQSQEPNFAADYTANKAKYATTPAALRSFQKLQETNKYMNNDYLATTFDDGIKMLAEGKGAHYPMLSFIIANILQNYPDKIEDIGFFAMPGDNADQNGLTVWLPGAVYVYKNSKHVEEAKLFANFVGSVEGMAAVGGGSRPTGPYVVKGAELPGDTPQVVKDMLPYFENGKTAPALEFLSPIKGPNLPSISVEVGAGLRSAEDAAKAYDKDVEKQAQQLGLAGW